MPLHFRPYLPPKAQRVLAIALGGATMCVWALLGLSWHTGTSLSDLRAATPLALRPEAAAPVAAPIAIPAAPAEAVAMEVRPIYSYTDNDPADLARLKTPLPPLVALADPLPRKDQVAGLQSTPEEAAEARPNLLETDADPNEFAGNPLLEEKRPVLQPVVTPHVAEVRPAVAPVRQAPAAPVYQAPVTPVVQPVAAAEVFTATPETRPARVLAQLAPEAVPVTRAVPRQAPVYAAPVYVAPQRPLRTAAVRVRSPQAARPVQVAAVTPAAGARPAATRQPVTREILTRQAPTRAVVEAGARLGQPSYDPASYTIRIPFEGAIASGALRVKRLDNGRAYVDVPGTRSAFGHTTMLNTADSVFTAGAMATVPERGATRLAFKLGRGGSVSARVVAGAVLLTATPETP